TAVVQDTFGNETVGGHLVAFTPSLTPLGAAGGALGALSAIPDASGNATVSVTSNTVAGTWTVTAQLLGALGNVIFTNVYTVTNGAGPPAVIVADNATINMVVLANTSVGFVVRDSFNNLVTNA